MKVILIGLTHFELGMLVSPTIVFAYFVFKLSQNSGTLMTGGRTNLLVMSSAVAASWILQQNHKFYWDGGHRPPHTLANGSDIKESENL